MAITATPRPATSSPLNPLTRTRKILPSTTNTTTHLSNLDRLLQKHSPPPPPHLTHDPGKSDPHDTLPPGNPTAPSNFLHALNLHALFNPPDEMTSMSPRSLRHLKRLLSDTSRLSPRNTIAPNWPQYHGANNWGGLLDPLDENLRRELIRYGDLVQAAYHAFHSNPAVSPDRHRHVILPDRNYRVTRSLYATSSIDLPKWVHGVAPWVTQQSSWIGYVAVCDNEREIQRMGRRDIVIALRGTATYLEWAENFRAGLVPINDDVSKPGPHVPKVECGFKSLYKTAGAHVPSLAESVRDEVIRLMERYKDEEISITVTGHSLGAALAVLVADELSHVPDVPPIAVFSFGGPRVGNRGFADRVENNGVKVLRVVNANDMVTRVPVGPPLMDGYVDVGQELRVDSRESPYLRANADAACCHDLEAYLHLVDGFLGTHCPFRSNANRSLNRLLNQQGPNVKKVYVATAQSLAMDLLDPSGGARSGVGTCLPSPSH